MNRRDFIKTVVAALAALVVRGKPEPETAHFKFTESKTAWNWASHRGFYEIERETRLGTPVKGTLRWASRGDCFFELPEKHAEHKTVEIYGDDGSLTGTMTGTFYVVDDEQERA